MALFVAPSPRWRLLALTALAGAVLAAHAWLLASPLLPAADVAPARTSALAAQALTTRTVVLAPVSAAAADAAAAAAAAAVPAASAQVTQRPPARAARPRPNLASTAPPSLVPVAPADWPTETPGLTPETASEVALGSAASAVPPAVPAADAPVATPVATPVESPSTNPTGPSATSRVDAPTAPAVSAEDTSRTASKLGQAPAGLDGTERAVVPFAPPPSARLSYEVQVEFRGVRQNIGGVLDWKSDGENYRLHMVVEVPFLGSRVQLSEGRLGRNGIHPKRFSEKTRSERAAHFEEADARIRYSANTPDAPLLPGHQDRLSVFMQLAGLAQARPERFAAGQVVPIPTSGVRESETWVFEVKGSETISLPRGPLEALHLRRLPRKEFDTTVDVWLAPSLGHLPVRMRLLEANGNVADQRLIAP